MFLLSVRALTLRATPFLILAAGALIATGCGGGSHAPGARDAEREFVATPPDGPLEPFNTEAYDRI